MWRLGDARAGGGLVHLCVALAVVLLATSAPALAASGHPKGDPESLWNAYPLNPTDEGLASARRPTVQSSLSTTAARADGATSGDSRMNVAFLALAGGAGVVALVVLGLLFAVRLRSVRSERPRTVPLWQGTTRLGTEPVWRPRPEDVESPLRLSPSGGQRRRVTRGSAARRGSSRLEPSTRDLRLDLRRSVWRVRDVLWTEDSAPLLVGSAVAVVVALVFFYLVG